MLPHEIWTRLRQGLSIEQSHLPAINGRLDLRFLQLPELHYGPQRSVGPAMVRGIRNPTEIVNKHWTSIDFSSSILPSVRFKECALYDCIFDMSKCDDWRVWGSHFDRTSFRGAQLAGAVLGGVLGRVRNRFHNVDFSSADLSKTVYTSAEFVACDFSNAKLQNINFQTSSFVDCVFAGELREVIFNRAGFKGRQFPDNQMTGVDFTRATLRWVEFRGLDLRNVHLPSGNKHLVLTDYKSALQKLCNFFGARTDLHSRKLQAFFSAYLKHAPEKSRSISVISKKDIVEVAGEAALDEVIRIADIP